MKLSTDLAENPVDLAVANGQTFAFNQKQLRELLDNNPHAGKVLFLQRVCEVVEQQNDTDSFIFARAFDGGEIPNPSDTDPQACPFPPGWQQLTLHIKTANPAHNLNFSVSRAALEALLGTNTFKSGNGPVLLPQLIARIETRAVIPSEKKVLSLKSLNEQGAANGSPHVEAETI